MLIGPLARVNAGNAVAAFGALVLGLLWLGVAWDLDRDRQRVVTQAEADTANLARAFEEHFQRTVDGLDQTLRTVKAEYERAPARFDLKDAAARASMLRQVSVQLGIIGPDGILVDSTVAGASRVDLSDREHFKVHRDAANDALFISAPVLGRASGRWSIQLTRRLDKGDGSFGGVVVLSLDPHYLSAFYGSIDLGAKGAVMLVGRDGIVRASSRGELGASLGAPEVVQSLFAARGGSVVMAGPHDQERRIVSFRSLPALPLAVLVGRSEAEVLAQHEDTRLLYLTVGMTLTLVLGLAVVALHALVRRQEVIARDLSAKKAELLSSRERLRRYVADLERIAEVAAHDLQEPLRRVVAYAQLLSTHTETALDSESRDYVAHVVAGAQRMRKLVKDLEAFVAVDHLPAVAALVPAQAAMDAALERLGEDLRGADAEVVVEDLPAVAADDKSLTEIFTQLVDNALRYRSPASRPAIHVAARQEGAAVVFTIRDNGLGIEERHLPRVFEIFHRLNGIDGRPNTGMGLAIVRRMVERLGGRVWVESRLGCGSTFSFSLPCEVPVPEQEARAA